MLSVLLITRSEIKTERWFEKPTQAQEQRQEQRHIEACGRIVQNNCRQV